MDVNNNAIFTAILETRSLTVIHYSVEDKLKEAEKHPMEAEDRALLEKIQNMRSLDEIWVVCHTRLAAWHTHAAAIIQKFLDRKKGLRP